MHYSLRLYTFCKAMKWNHLPEAGGIYAQHPQFVDDMMMLMGLDSEAENRRQEKQQAEMKAKQRRR